MAKKPKIDLKKFQRKLEEAVGGFRDAGSLSVIIGLPSDRIHNPSGLSLAELGAIHEFGVGNVPERSFLRGGMHANKKEIKKLMHITAKKIAKGGDPEKAMEQLALAGQGLIQTYIGEGSANFAPLAPSTVSRRKNKSSNPLNDTGALRQGIIGLVVKDD